MKRRTKKLLISVFILFGVLINCVPTSAAFSMNGFNFGMSKGDTFIINCCTPAGMKPKRVTCTRLSKKTVTEKDLRYEENLIEYYDNFFGIYKYDDYFDAKWEAYMWGNSEIAVRNRYYKAMFNKLDIIKVRLNYSREWTPTKTEIAQCIYGGNFYNHEILFTDYNTGRSLCTASLKQTVTGSKYGVKVIECYWHSGRSTYFYDDYRNYVRLTENGYVDITIIKPKSYTGLCVGVAGRTQLYYSQGDLKYYKKTATIKATSYYQKAPNNIHYARFY